MNSCLRDELEALLAIYNDPPRSAFSWIDKNDEDKLDAYAVFTEPARKATLSFSITPSKYPASIGSDALQVAVSVDGSGATGASSTLTTTLKEAIKKAVPGEPLLFDVVDIFQSCFQSITPVGLKNSSTSLTFPLMPPATDLKNDPFLITTGFRSHLQPLDLQLLMQTAQKHVESSISESNLGTLLQAYPIVTKKLVEKFLAKHQELFNKTKVWTPTFAFHATANKDFIPSIIENGLLGAGDFTADGDYISTQHGALYGKGIYVSPSVAFADNYSFDDYMENKQLVLCLVNPGNVLFVTEPTSPKEWQEHWNYMANRPIKEGADSHILHKKQFVLKESSQILPLLLCTYGGSNLVKQKQAAQYSATSKSLDYHEERVGKKLEKIVMDPLLSRSVVPTTIPSNTDKFYTLTLSPSILQRLDPNTTTTETHLILLLDRSKSIGRRTFQKLVLPACSLLTKKVGATRTDAIFFGDTVDQFPHIKNGFFETDKILGMELQGGTNILEAYKVGLEIALKTEEAAKREFENLVAAEAEKEVVEVREKEAEEKKFFERLNDDKKKNRLEDGIAFVGLDEEEEKARDFKVKAEAVRKNATRRETVYAFVLITDGEDTFNDEPAFDKVLEKYSKMVFGAGLKTLFKVIGLGKNSNTRVGLKANMATQTLYQSAHESPVFYCQKAHEIPVVAANLGSKIASSLNYIEINSPNCHINEGFVKNWTSPPVSTIFASVSLSGDSKTILFRGTPPPFLWLNWQRIRINLSETPSNSNNTLILFREYLLDVKVSVITRVHYKIPTNELLDLLQRFRNDQLSVENLKDLKAENRASLMRAKRGLLMDLDAILNELRVDLASVETRLNNEDAAKWLAPVKSMKFAKAVVKRVGQDGIVGEEELAQDITKVKEWRKHESLECAGPVSGQSGMTALQHLRDMANLETKNLTVSDYLYSCGYPGIAIEVFRSQAAIVNPWNLIVKYVSSDVGDSASALCMLHAGITWRDQHGHATEDVLIVAEPQKDDTYKIFSSLKLFKAYTSIVFSRNPDLYLPQQRIALLSISLVKAIEELYLHRPSPNSTRPTIEIATKSETLVRNIFNIIYTIRKVSHKSTAWNTFLTRLMEPIPSRYLTESTLSSGGIETDSVLSIAQVLVAMVAFASFETDPKKKATSILHSGNETQLSEAALAILGESVSRGCRLKIKSTDTPNPKRYREFIREALSINSDAYGEDGWVVVPDAGVWIVSGKKYSAKFFNNEKWRTNASPTAVAACLAFSRWCVGYWGGKTESLEDLLYDTKQSQVLFQNVLKAAKEDGGMHEFLTLYSEDLVVSQDGGTMLASKDLLQIALYVQGIRYHDSKSRRIGLSSLTDAHTVIANIIEEERTNLYKDYIAQKQKELHNLRDYEAKRFKIDLNCKKQALFLHAHQDFMPRLFTHGEIASLNQTRPPSDQLELMPGGMLKHHCSNEKCPEYLLNQATDNDRLYNRRNGLYRHLKWLFIPTPRYIPNFHVLIEHFITIHTRKGLSGDNLRDAIIESFWTNDTTKKVVRELGVSHLEHIVGGVLNPKS
ncbi:UNVERIFIED_CONTAM: hypothetical protein HDU68_007545 [Siphonaria sp. JEL0065]|nr:hypothetical protein HDU68_007545 [Siphonaria sp. JEL0065]